MLVCQPTCAECVCIELMNSGRCASDRPSESTTVDAIAVASAGVVGHAFSLFSCIFLEVANIIVVQISSVLIKSAHLVAGWP